MKIEEWIGLKIVRDHVSYAPALAGKFKNSHVIRTCRECKYFGVKAELVPGVLDFKTDACEWDCPDFGCIHFDQRGA